MKRTSTARPARRLVLALVPALAVVLVVLLQLQSLVSTSAAEVLNSSSCAERDRDTNRDTDTGRYRDTQRESSAALLQALESLSVSEVAVLALLALLLLSVGISAGVFAQNAICIVRATREKERERENENERGSESEGVKTSNNNSKGSSSSGDPIDKSKVPKHIAVIMDGNRRFGREKHSDALQGHWAGGQVLVDFVQWCMEDGVQIATVYAFSTENWNRDSIEVTTLMTIFAKYAETFRTEALSRNVKVNVFSTEFDKLPPKVQVNVKELVRATSHCNGFTLNICLSYGSRSEIVNACKSIAQDVTDGKYSIDSIEESTLSAKLLTSDYPDPDILIRTSGEYRLSNFLLWQCAYSELFFVDKYWPQLTQSDLRTILQQFVKRSRRFGK